MESRDLEAVVQEETDAINELANELNRRPSDADIPDWKRRASKRAAEAHEEFRDLLEHGVDGSPVSADGYRYEAPCPKCGAIASCTWSWLEVAEVLAGNSSSSVTQQCAVCDEFVMFCCQPSTEQLADVVARGWAPASMLLAMARAQRPEQSELSYHAQERTVVSEIRSALGAIETLRMVPRIGDVDADFELMDSAIVALNRALIIAEHDAAKPEPCATNVRRVARLLTKAVAELLGDK